MAGPASNHSELLAAAYKSPLFKQDSKEATNKQKLMDNLQNGATKQIDGFMKIFLATLKKPNIDNPPDMMQLTSALASYSQVGQQVETNKLLGEMNLLSKHDIAYRAKSYLNKTVEFESDFLEHKGGDQKISFKLPPQVSKAELSIIDGQGQAVTRFQVDPKAGEKTVIWNGKNKEGQDVPAGTYKLSVVATDKKSTLVGPITTRITGVVDGFSTPQNNEHDVTYHVGDILVKGDNILRVANDDRSINNTERLEARLKRIEELLEQYLADRI